MASSVRAKIILLTVTILIIAVVAVTAASSYVFSRVYSRALLSQGVVLAHSLKQQLERLLRLGIAIDELVGFEKQCQEIVSQNEGIVSAMVLNPEGRILFHSDPSQHVLTLTDRQTQKTLKDGREYVETSLEANDRDYDIFVPVFDRHSEYVAMIRVSFPARVVGEKTKTILGYSLIIAGVCLLLAVTSLVGALSILVNRPLARLMEAIAGIRNTGTNTYQHVQISSPDEFGQVGLAFNEMIDDLNQTHGELKHYAQELETRVTERTAQLEEANDQLQRDIQERQRIEASLRESEERLVAITDSAMDAVILVDESGIISYWNPAATRMFGFNREEAMGQVVQTLLVPEKHRDFIIATIARMRTTGLTIDGHGTLAGIALRKGGERFPVEFSVAPTRIKERWHATGIIRDVSERKRLEDELARSQRFESIGVLAGGIAHDFNNLLAIIMGHISLAQTCLASQHQSRHLLQQAERASFQARDLILQLIEVSRGVAPVKQTMDLTDLVRDAVLFPLTGSHITCQMVLHQDLWPVSCDPDQIRQVIVQVVRNAREATPEGSQIEVEARNLELDRNVIPSIQPGRYLRISITDHGQGISPDLLPRIFDPYVSGKERGIQKGMGLGLAIVYAILRRHAGHIHASSIPGQGATFDIYLPAAAMPAGGVTADAST
jgi:PAS domain S-box-containing protein